MAMSGQQIVQGLIQRGYSPIHAAALAGHILQESGGDPGNVNPKEDAHGLLQWRLDRWGALQDFARKRGASPSDPDVQLDFVGHELSGSEARAAKPFLGAADLPSASAALKGYIRFGDASDATRLRNAEGLVGGGGAGAALSRPSPASGASAPVAAPTQDDALVASLQAIPKQIAASTPEPMQLQPFSVQPVVTPAIARARQLAQAMISRPLVPGA